MKKFFYLFFALMCMMACTEKNTPVNPGGGENPGGGDNPGGGEVTTYKPKYLSQYEYWYSYQDKSTNTSWGMDVGDISKTIYERGTDVKYLKSETSYLNDNLIRTISYKNSGNADFGVYTAYTASPELIGTAADTTYWYDEARSLPQKTISAGSVTTYTYDKDGFALTQVTEYKGKKSTEIQYTYSGNYRYGKTYSYDTSTGELNSTGHDTLLYENKNLRFLKSWRSTSISEGPDYTLTNRSIYDYENGQYGITHLNAVFAAKMVTKSSGDVTYSSNQKYVYNYTYQDELHYDLEMKYYNTEDNLWCIQNYKYAYVR